MHKQQPDSPSSSWTTPFTGFAVIRGACNFGWLFGRRWIIGSFGIHLIPTNSIQFNPNTYILSQMYLTLSPCTPANLRVGWMENVPICLCLIYKVRFEGIMFSTHHLSCSQFLVHSSYNGVSAAWWNSSRSAYLLWADAKDWRWAYWWAVCVWERGGS